MGIENLLRRKQAGELTLTSSGEIRLRLNWAYAGDQCFLPLYLLELQRLMSLNCQDKVC